MTKAWRNFGRINGSDLGKHAIRVYICRGCGMWFEGAAPVQCSCGRLDWDKFDSKGEARRWMQLRLLDRAGEITELRRQVPFPLMTITDDGKPVEWGKYIADFVYRENGVRIIEDSKARSGISPEAAIKLRIMESSGRPVRLTT